MSTRFLTATDWRQETINNKYFFKYSPVTKLLMISLTSVTFFINIFQLEASVIMPFYGLNPTIIPNFQVWRLVSHQLYVGSSIELILAIMLLYYLRLIEMRLGTVKFLSNLVITSTISIFFKVGIQIFLPMRNTIGPSEILTSLMIFYYKYVPHYQRIRIFRFNITNKAYIYILFLQFVLINIMSNLLSITCGILSTLIVSSSNLPFYKFRIPTPIVQFISRHIIDLNLFDSQPTLAYCLYTPHPHPSNPYLPQIPDEQLDGWNHLLANNQNNINNDINNDINNNFNNNNINPVQMNPYNLFFNQNDLFASLQQLYQNNHFNNFNNFNNFNIFNRHQYNEFEDEIQVESSSDHQQSSRGEDDEDAEEVRNNPYLLRENVNTLQSLFGFSKEECIMILQQTNNDVNLAISVLLSSFDEN